jgi:hypothetical protein
MVFAHNGLIHRFITTIAAVEFTRPGFDEETLFEKESYLTHLFRVYYLGFGERVLGQIFRPIFEAIVKAGDLGLKEGTLRDSAVIDLVNKVVDLVVQGMEMIPVQFKHMCSVLKSITATALRSRRAVFNCISAFLFKYGFQIALSGKTVSDMELSAGDQAVCESFGSVFRMIFGLRDTNGKLGESPALAEAILSRYDEIYNSVMDVAVVKEEVAYPKRTDEICKGAIKRILERISGAREAFVRRYIDYYENDFGNSASCFAVAELISRMFLD